MILEFQSVELVHNVVVIKTSHSVAPGGLAEKNLGLELMDILFLDVETLHIRPEPLSPLYNLNLRTGAAVRNMFLLSSDPIAEGGQQSPSGITALSRGDLVPAGGRRGLWTVSCSIGWKENWTRSAEKKKKTQKRKG